MHEIPSDVYKLIKNSDFAYVVDFIKNNLFYREGFDPIDYHGYKLSNSEHPRLTYSFILSYDKTAHTIVPIMLHFSKDRYVRYADGNVFRIKGQKLGQGNTGIVKKGEFADGEEVAVKIINLKKPPYVSTERALEEGETLHKVGLAISILERKAISIDHVETTKPKIYFVMKLLAGIKLAKLKFEAHIERLKTFLSQQGTIMPATTSMSVDRTLVTTPQKLLIQIHDLCTTTSNVVEDLNQEQKVKLALKITTELQKIHALDIIHCDLKAENILFDKEKFEVHIIDFGLSRQSGIKIENKYFGTPAYMAPEVSNGYFVVNPSIDIYALGVIFKKIIKINELGLHITDKLIKDMLSDAPSKRPSLCEIITKLDSLKPKPSPLPSATLKTVSHRRPTPYPKTINKCQPSLTRRSQYNPWKDFAVAKTQWLKQGKIDEAKKQNCIPSTYRS